ncbi:TlpA family protein disulfide reductase [Candidatus Poribacteria bacterium]|nr:TlpA family protein disulfide reductase [Candidatus Poribacteria bacterium]
MSAHAYRPPFLHALAASVCLILAVTIHIGCGEDAPTDGVGNDDVLDDAGNGDAALAPAFTLATLSGDTVALEEHRGKVVMVNFWATWCAPCREEMPLFEQLRAGVGAEDFEILAVSVDEEPLEAIPAFLDEIGGLSYPVLLGTPEVVADYNIGIGLPTTYIVSRDGRVVETLIGGQALDVFEPLVRKHL